MLIVTTPSLQNREIKEYAGLVTGRAIMGTNIFKDLFANIRDIVGGRSGAYEEELQKAQDIAVEEMIRDAEAHGADAILSVDLDFETISNGSTNMLMVCASGTAVKLA